ncbi:FAD-dependent oxidoreductase [bacterium]|nr:FAD-dependent oxidoreductase [bacterium]
MDIVIIGGVAAGAKAAAKAKRVQPEANVKIYTEDTHVSYSSCGLPYYIEGNFEDYKTLLVRSVEEFAASGIDVYLKSRVEKILPVQKDILIARDTDAEVVKYDKLIIATGANAIVPEIKGIHKYENIYTLRKIEDGINIRKKMLESSTVTIIGSGYIGLELLEAFVKNGLRVNVIESNKKIMGGFDDDISDLIRKRLESSSIGNFEFFTNEEVVEITGENKEAKIIRTSSGKEIETDMIVLCTGVKPNIKIAQDAGIEIGQTGAIKVNKLMHTSIEDIYACGDCAEKRHIVSGRPVWIPLGSTANKEGRCAAMNAAGEYCEFEGVLGSTVTRCLNTTMSKTGLTEEEAKEVGFSPISALVLKTDRVAYMPEAGDITLKVVADKVTGLLLGGQAIGAVGADKRINTLTSALLGHLTVEAFNNNDLTYAPPYSTTIDPLLNAMQILTAKMRKIRQN